MLKLASYDIVFQEIPDEVTLALNLSGCPNRCSGCHSPHLQQEIGESLDDELLDGLLATYGRSVTCVCLMGGDGDPLAVEGLACRIKQQSGGKLKTGWYSGRSRLPEGCAVSAFDYIKLGPYVEQFGGLDAPTTNQRLYRIREGEMQDITASFHGRKLK